MGFNIGIGIRLDATEIISDLNVVALRIAKARGLPRPRPRPRSVFSSVIVSCRSTFIAAVAPVALIVVALTVVDQVCRIGHRKQIVIAEVTQQT